MTTYDMTACVMTNDEIDQVSGGDLFADSAGIGAGAGAAIGIIATGTAAGAANGGAVGAALGFSFAVGYTAGTGIVYLFGVGFRALNAR